MLSYYVFKGFFWMIICNGSVMINDVMAYVFGKTFGRTQLIKLSPNKTWEGFIGGGVSTIIFAMFVSNHFSLFYPFFIIIKHLNIAHLFCFRNSKFVLNMFIFWINFWSKSHELLKPRLAILWDFLKICFFVNIPNVNMFSIVDCRSNFTKRIRYLSNDWD